MLWKCCMVGLMARIALLLYGNWQDDTMEVKFTDVDYFVFDDAAKFVSEGGSPYQRATYRYTPLLAYMLVPNYWLPSFGKILFIIFDILTGILTYHIFTSSGHNHSTASICACLWLFNPLPMAVSSRGNAESIMSFLVLLTLLLLQKKRIFWAAFAFTMAVHFKIYPVTYALPIYLLIGNDYLDGRNPKLSKFTQLKNKSAEMDDRSVKGVIKGLLPNRCRLVFMLVGPVVLGGLTALFYTWYGWQFLYETYLYHIVRQDTRHNFSPYFYMLYLLGSDSSGWIRILTFLPQCLLLITFSVKYYRDPPFCWFLITFAFVAFNKVCTSQYFLWYLCLIPFLLPIVDITVQQTAVLVILWFLGQGVWLLPAYYLEFEGVNSFLYIWLAGLFYLLVNMYILYTIIVNYQPVQQHPHTKMVRKHEHQD